MPRALVGAALCALLTSPALAADVGLQAMLWSKIELSSSLTAKFINNGSCRSSELYRKSCVAAIQAASAVTGVQEQVDDGDFEHALLRLERQRPSGVPAQWIRGSAIRAHMRTFDPYAEFLPTAQLAIESHEEYVGVGLVLTAQKTGVLIKEVYPFSPAAAAGLRTGDTIVQMTAPDGLSQSTLDLDDQQLDFLFFPRPGKKLELTVERKATAETLSVALTPQPIEVANVESTFIGFGTGYLRIRNFDDLSVCKQVHTGLGKLRSAGAQKLILDLRDNPGGEKIMALCVAEKFVGQRPLLGTKYLSSAVPALDSIIAEPEYTIGSETIEWESGLRPADIDWPMVVLIDKGTMSSAEIVAGALQDNQRASLIGEKSFGKGVAQQWRALQHHPGLTVAWTSERLFKPSGTSNQDVGITPEYEVSNGPQLSRSPTAAFPFATCLDQVNSLPYNPVIDRQVSYGMAVLNCDLSYTTQMANAGPAIAQ